MTLIDSDSVDSVYQLVSSKDLLYCEHSKLGEEYKSILKLPQMQLLNKLTIVPLKKTRSDKCMFITNIQTNLKLPGN